MNTYEVFGVNIVRETRSAIYEANSPEEAIAMARNDLEGNSYPFMDWELVSYSIDGEIELPRSFLIE